MGYLTRSDFLRLSGLATAGICAQALLSSCSPGTTTPAATTAAEGPGTDGVKMGVSIWSSTDPLGALSVDIIRQAANALGAEVVVVDHAYVPERVTASVETLAAAGCDGIVVCNATDAEMASIIRSCDDNDVYVTQFYRHIREDGQEAGPTGVRALAEASSGKADPLPGIYPDLCQYVPEGKVFTTVPKEKADEVLDIEHAMQDDPSRFESSYFDTEQVAICADVNLLIFIAREWHT